MDLRIDVEIKDELLLVTAYGSVTFDDVLRMLRQVCDMAAEDQIDKVLVNSLALGGELAAHERYRLGTEMATYLTDRGIDLKLALVGVPPVVNGYGARVAQNRGITTRVFATPQEALTWLVEPLGASPGGPETL